MAVEISSALLLRMMRSVRVSTLLSSGDCEVVERCGILRGRDHRITALDFTKNVAADPRHSFEIDPGALIAAYRKQRRARALKVMGYFHTHPSGSCAPSERDADGAVPDGSIWAIASDEGVLLWRAVPNGTIHGRFDRVVFDLRTGRRVERGCPGVRCTGHKLEARGVI